MKKIFISAITLLIAVSSCKKLDETVYTNISSNVFYSSAGNVFEALTAVYKNFQLAYGYDYTYYLRIETASETCGPGGTKENPPQYNNWSFPNNSDNTIPTWADSYKVINQANAVIGNIGNVNMDATLKTTYTAEARFLRGLTYFYLLRIFGGVAIPQNYTTSLADLNVPRSTIDQLMTI